jgi:hypothetical protein
MNVTPAPSQVETQSADVSFHGSSDRPAPGKPIHATKTQSAPGRIVRTVDLRGPAGRLEALVNEGGEGVEGVDCAPDAPFAALVCHPHPLGGGTLHNKVVYHAMKALNDPAWGLGIPVLRFNFRGAGRSEGAHDGEAEAGDVLAALDWLENEFKRPIVAAGFSFGAAMVLRACCAKRKPPSVRALVALGLPVQAEGHAYEYSFLRDSVIPKLFISGDRDRFAPVTQLKLIVDSSADPKRLQLLPGADHFFTGQLELMQRALSGWLKEQFS